MRVFTLCLIFLPIATSQKWLRTNRIDESNEDSVREGRMIMSMEKKGNRILETPSKEIPSQLINQGSENRKDTDDKRGNHTQLSVIFQYLFQFLSLFPFSFVVFLNKQRMNSS